MSELVGLAVVKSELREFKRRLEDFATTQEDHDKCLYRGDEKAPGLVERMRATEGDVRGIKAAKTEKSLREWAVFLLLASIFLTQIIDRIWPHK